MLPQDHVRQLDRADPLGHFRDRFELPADVVYLDGNSLGALPRSTGAHVAEVIAAQWGDGLVRSWNSHDWIGLAKRLGSGIAPLIGARPDEVIACDSTTVNLFKVLDAALALRPDRTVIVTEADGFPTDRYIADAVAARGGRQVRATTRENLAGAIDDRTAVVLLTHVDYRSGHMFDMAAITAAAHRHGALVLWDLSHSAGAVAVALDACEADLAVGCGYKYLNGGPGAPGYLYVRRDLQEKLASPLPGWMGHARPFDFSQGYRPAEGIERFLCGTPAILAMAALEQGLATFDDVDLPALFAKGRQLGDLCIALMEARCAGFGLALASPRDSAHRGSHVSFAHPDAYAICQALIARNVIGDFRTPDILRFGFAPLYTRFIDVWLAVDALVDVMAHEEWRDSRFSRRSPVT